MTEQSPESLSKLRKEFEKIKFEIRILENKLDEKKVYYKALKKQIEEAETKAILEENKKNIEVITVQLATDWEDKTFPWSEKVVQLLHEKFELDRFRPKQLPAINVMLSKKDLLVVMPTGSGKSLIYQLAALIDKGITIVVSPLLSLIEDQLIALKKLDIPAAAMSSSTSKEDTKMIYEDMKSREPRLKLLYVTPEWIGKSKRFLSALQKTYEAGCIARVAIDEVHCCSTWGHDFRPDYNFLGVLRSTIPGVPFLGVTATATINVLTNVQQMLHMENCMIIVAPFNRPNLYYKVIVKQVEEDSVKMLAKWMTRKYAEQSGIIYVNTVNETISLATELKKYGVRVAPYHAQLTPENKQLIHKKWIDKKYVAVVATIAFGMGIDKPDVRYVIHYTMPRSIYSLYQESGRAGRDGKPADCIVFFSLNDFLKGYGFANSLADEERMWTVLNYCLDQENCRRATLCKHFDEVWNPSHCQKMCDHCNSDYDEKNLVEFKAKPAYNDICTLIKLGSSNGEKLTLNKLLDAWYQKGPKKARRDSISAPRIPRHKAEKFIGYLLLDKYLKIEKGYNTYSTICYLQIRSPMTLNDLTYKL